MCLLCLYQIHNFISNVLIRVYVRMWPGVRKTEMKRDEKADKKRVDKKHLQEEELIQHSFHLGLKIEKKPLSDLLCMRDLIVIRQP